MASLLSRFHAAVVVPLVVWWETVVLGQWEEMVLSWVRQVFQETARFINGFIALVLTFISREYRGYRDSLRKSWEQNPWQKWWQQMQSRPSTFNAILASLQQQEEPGEDGEYLRATG